jgi:hypothetical protein
MILSVITSVTSYVYSYLFVKKDDRSIINRTASPMILWCLRHPTVVAGTWYALKAMTYFL